MSAINPRQIQQVGATDGQSLVWDQAAGRWRPGTVASSGGGGVENTPGWYVAATGTGTSQNVTLPESIPARSILVFVNGLRQDPASDYSVTGTVLTITVLTGDTIYIEKPAGSPGPPGEGGGSGGPLADIDGGNASTVPVVSIDGGTAFG